MAFRPADWPLTCGYGHDITPGRSFYGGWTICTEPCGGPAHGHHYLRCAVYCDAQLWLGHAGAVWTSRSTGEPIQPGG